MNTKSGRRLTRLAVLLLLLVVALGAVALVVRGQQESAADHAEQHDHDHSHDHDHDHDHDVQVEEEEPAPTGPSDVLVLTDDTIAAALQEHPLMLVEFYAPWCGHCKALAPEWEKAATELKSRESKIVLAKVDCTTQTRTAETYGIEGYPTIKLFRDGQAAGEYQGPRSSDAIVRFAEKQLLPATRLLSTPEESHAFVETLGAGVIVIGFFDKADPGTPAFDEFVKAAQQLRNDGFEFGHAVNQSVLDKFLIKSVPALIIFKDDDKPDLFYPSESEPFQASFIVDWLNRNRLPALDEIGGHNFPLYLRSGLPMAVLFVNYSREAETQAAKDLVRAVANNFRGKVPFVYADGGRFERQVKRLGLSGTKFPAVTIDTLRGNQHFAFPEDQELTEENLNNWLNKFVAGQLSPTIRSQPVPEPSSDPLKVIVGNTFERDVMDENKDVFLKIYAPWCGHCKALAPTWERLAQRLQNISSVLIGKLDATENDTPVDHLVQGYPTLLFFPAKDKANPVAFEQDRTMDNLLEFIKQHASIPFEIPQDNTTPSTADDVPPTEAEQQPATEEQAPASAEEKNQHDEL